MRFLLLNGGVLIAMSFILNVFFIGQKRFVTLRHPVCSSSFNFAVDGILQMYSGQLV